MIKYFIIEDKLYVEKMKKGFKFKEEFRTVIKQLKKEFEFEATGYHEWSDKLMLTLTKKDKEKFADQLVKNKSRFKKSSKINKRFLELASDIEVNRMPSISWDFDFNVYGKSKSQQFIQDGIAYGMYENESDYKLPSGLKEIKASEYYLKLEKE